MCGRYANTKSGEELGAYFEADEVDAVAMPPSWNIAPTQQVPIVVDRLSKDDPDGVPSRLVTTARWSLVPRWATELTSKYPTFNARSETVTEKATFKNSVVRSRGLLPADGYYEWHTVAGADGAPVKTPHWITDPVDGMLAFAGLYSWWRPPQPSAQDGGEPAPWVLTATMLTRAAHGPAASIHDRAPVTLPRETWDTWLDPTVEGDAALVDMVVAESEIVLERLQFHAVAPLRGDGPTLIEPV
jgi:putative SOS response-associated peptidase YedK